MLFASDFLIMFYFRGVFHWGIFENSIASLMWSVLLGFVLLIAGAIMEYEFFLLFYKKPVSKRMIGGQAMKEL
jgi:hypothetical protein